MSSQEVESRRPGRMLWIVMLVIFLLLLCLFAWRQCGHGCGQRQGSQPVGLTADELVEMVCGRVNPADLLRVDLQLTEAEQQQVAGCADFLAIVRREVSSVVQAHGGSVAQSSAEGVLEALVSAVKGRYMADAKVCVERSKPEQAPAEADPEDAPAQDRGESERSASIYRVNGNDYYALFALNSDLVQPTEILRLLAARVKRLNCAVELAGYADEVGQDAYNQRLSRRRVDAMKAVLVQLGVPAKSISVKGLGSTTQFGSDEQNRRVTIHLEPAQ